jgi:hypothetical protein
LGSYLNSFQTLLALSLSPPSCVGYIVEPKTAHSEMPSFPNILSPAGREKVCSVYIPTYQVVCACDVFIQIYEARQVIPWQAIFHFFVVSVAGHGQSEIIRGLFILKFSRRAVTLFSAFSFKPILNLTHFVPIHYFSQITRPSADTNLLIFCTKNDIIFLSKFMESSYIIIVHKM